MNSGVSVIICCFNSEKTIPAVLHHLDKQVETNDLPWEVIVVNNASTDNTEEIAKQNWTRSDVPFSVISEENPGLSNARMKGLSAARQDIIVFVDDDNLLDKTYISKAHQIMSDHPDVGLAGGLGFPVTTVPLPGWFNAYQSAYAVGKQADMKGYLPEARTYLHGAGVIMRKNVWDHLISEGFTFLLSGRKGKALSSGEDSEITSAFRMAGYKLWYDPTLTFEHLIGPQRLEWAYLIRLAGAFGKTLVVLDLYRSEILEYRGWKLMKTRLWIFGTLVSLKDLCLQLPGYLKSKIRNEEGTTEEFQYHYFRGALLQWIALFTRLPRIKKEIKALHARLRESIK